MYFSFLNSLFLVITSEGLIERLKLLITVVNCDQVLWDINKRTNTSQLSIIKVLLLFLVVNQTESCPFFSLLVLPFLTRGTFFICYFSDAPSSGC